MQRRHFLSLAAGTAIAYCRPARRAAASGVLRASPHADLEVLDPGAADLRQAFLNASTDGTRHDALAQLQQRLLEAQPSRILGQFEQASLWRSNITAPRPAAVTVFWNIAKT